MKTVSNYPLLMFAVSLPVLLLAALSGVLAQKAWRFGLPVTVSTSFFPIADIDSPQSGLVNVAPHNLDRLATSLERA